RLKKTHTDPSKLFQRFRANSPLWLGTGVAEFRFVVCYHGPETAKKGQPATFFFDHRPSVIDEELSKSVARYIAFLESGGETEYTRLFIDRWTDVVNAAKDPPEIVAEEREELVREFSALKLVHCPPSVFFLVRACNGIFAVRVYLSHNSLQRIEPVEF
ncbi:MAG: hypothetical protein GY737_27685, partial [Desulfobacteraceae bacterium]|nr:hypothetical protein [Desulfobacteraceae bacterium]